MARAPPRLEHPLTGGRSSQLALAPVLLPALFALVAFGHPSPLVLAGAYDRRLISVIRALELLVDLNLGLLPYVPLTLALAGGDRVARRAVRRLDSRSPAHDPLYITPILMGITMVVQQRMTPTAGDPMQQNMMMFMPVVFTGMFLWAQSGLVIYWFVSNLWGIGQQWLTNRLIGPPKVRTVRPPAERRLKKAGSGRSEQAEQQGAMKEQA